MRIDQAQRLVPLLGEIHHQDALMHVHLGGCKPDTVFFVHGLQHIFHERADTRIDFGDRPGLYPQPRVRIVKDGELCHRGCPGVSVEIHRV